MVPFLIDKNVTGAPQHLLCNADGLTWVTESPNDVLRWYHDCDVNVDDSLNVAMNLSGHSAKWKFEQKYVESLCAVMPGYRSKRDIKIPWHHIAPTRFSAVAIKRLVDDIRRVIDDTDVGYYRNVFCKQSVLFSSLKPARIDKKRLEIHISTERLEGVRASFLEGFRPPADTDMLPIVRYNRIQSGDSGTKTGRLTVSDGPSYPTLNREYRDIICSRWKGGSIWYLDYSSLEPRTFQAHRGKDIDKNFYQDLASTLLGDSGRVQDAKAMFIRRFYGASHETMSVDGNSSLEQARRFARHVDEDFGIREMTLQLQAEFTATGRVRNRFGRALMFESDVKPHVLMNNWVQSTATDIALLGFAAICRGIMRANVNIEPLAIIHDALIIDVHPASEKYIPILTKIGSRVPEAGAASFLMHSERLR